MTENEFYRTRDRYPAGPQAKRSRPESNTKFLLGLLAIFSVVGVAAVWSVVSEAVQDHNRQEALRVHKLKAALAEEEAWARRGLAAQRVRTNFDFLPGGMPPRPRKPALALDAELDRALDDHEAVQLTEPTDEQRAARMIRAAAGATRQAQQDQAQARQLAQQIAQDGLGAILRYEVGQGRRAPYQFKIVQQTTIVALEPSYRGCMVAPGQRGVRKSDGQIVVAYQVVDPISRRWLDRAALLYCEGGQFSGAVSLDSAAARDRHRETLEQYAIPTEPAPGPEPARVRDLSGNSLGGGL